MTMILLLCLVLLCSVLSLIDVGVYRQRITPFTMLAIPFTVVLALAVFFAEPLGFVAVDPGITVLWMLGLFSFWVGNLTFVFGSHGRRHVLALPCDRKALDEHQVIRVAKLFGWLSLAVSVVAIMIAVMNLGFGSIGTTEFSRIFSSGIAGHSVVVGSAVLLLLLGTVQKDQPKTIILILLLLIVSLLYSVRSWALIPIIGGAIYRILTGRLKITAGMVISIVVVGFTVFSSKYILGWLVSDSSLLLQEGNQLFLIRHFLAYIFAGILGGSEAIRIGFSSLTGANAATMFSPIITVMNLFANNAFGTVQIINPNYLRTSYEFEELSNVFTLFGTAQFHLGLVGMLLYGLGLGLACGWIYRRAIRTWRTIAMSVWSYIAACLFFSWFEMYFWHLNILEIPAILILISLLSRLKLKSVRFAWKDKKRLELL